MQVLWLIVFCGSALAVEKSMDMFNLLEREDTFDRSTRKLKPVREVIDENDIKDWDDDFPNIVDCGPDEAQSWYEPDPDDCSSYFVCTGKYYEHRRCSPGLCWDADHHSCKWPSEVECGSRPLPFSPETYEPFEHQDFDFEPYHTNLRTLQRQSQKRNPWLMIEQGEMGNDTDAFYEDFM